MVGGSERPCVVRSVGNGYFFSSPVVTKTTIHQKAEENVLLWTDAYE
jgi:hypothetical protein